ncbi:MULTISPECIES: hypothetical protein [unclassified Psychrobacter]|jgi:type II secretory pathway component PulF|uniref:hypothetical protein n=1 Tax=unclassified Psychrobacter TaxID=196806 RepID=UPI001918F121|nr:MULTISPECIES: hypothetical protein [unclassified Psychrobacter]
MKILAIATSFLFLFCAIVVILVTPTFGELYKSFGVDIPVFTKVVLSTHKYWLGLALIPIPLVYLLEPSKRWQATTQYFLLALAILLIPLTIIALYLPIFEMGSVVG